MADDSRPAAYDHRERTRATSADRHAAIGRRAALTLTGTIFVVFEVDERWGLGRYRICMDLECFDLLGGGDAG